jgi:hypothetical protein
MSRICCIARRYLSSSSWVNIKNRCKKLKYFEKSRGNGRKPCAKQIPPRRHRNGKRRKRLSLGGILLPPEQLSETGQAATHAEEFVGK